MSKLQIGEIKPGLVVYLDPAELRKHENTVIHAGFSLTGQDRAVTGGHFFLLVHVNVEHCMVDAVPLYSKRAKSRPRLCGAKKTGKMSAKWCEDSFWSPVQYWSVPFAAVVDASGSDNSDMWNRRGYAVNYPGDLKRIFEIVLENGNPLSKAS